MTHDDITWEAKDGSFWPTERKAKKRNKALDLAVAAVRHLGYTLEGEEYAKFGLGHDNYSEFHDEDLYGDILSAIEFIMESYRIKPKRQRRTAESFPFRHTTKPTNALVLETRKLTP